MFEQRLMLPQNGRSGSRRYLSNIYISVIISFTILGVGTKIDPTLCRADRMVGQVLGAVDALPDIYTELTISFFLLRRLLGVKTEGDKRGAKVNRAK